MNKNFDNLMEFLKTVEVKFSTLCISETWCETLDLFKDSNYVINGYKATLKLQI